MFKNLTIAALVLIFSGATFAAEESMYTKIDTDKDGSINQQEAAAYPDLSERWEELDTNADGMLDPAEFAKFEMISE